MVTLVLNFFFSSAILTKVYQLKWKQKSGKNAMETVSQKLGFGAMLEFPPDKQNQ